jgi:K+-sensing histidine kinase KdpD
MRPSRAEIEGRRRRLLVSSLVVVAALVGFAVGLSFFGPEVLGALGRSPAWIRIGVLVIASVFIGVALEDERRLENLSAGVERQTVVFTALENRLDALESLIKDDSEAGSAIDDTLRVVLDAAVDITGAEGGSVEYRATTGAPRALSSSSLADRVGVSPSISMPLVSRGQQIGDLTLVLPKGDEAVDEDSMEALNKLGERAGIVLEQAEKATSIRRSETIVRALNLLKSRFLATVSHELRTPLTSIVGYSVTLDEHWERLPDLQKREFVRSIEEQAERLARLVERMLEAARVEIEGASVSPLRHDVRMSVTNSLHRFLDAYPDRIEVRLPNAPLEAVMDPFVIDQVVSNLVDNAVRYTNDRIVIQVDGSMREVRIMVRDWGSGIEPGTVERVARGQYEFGEGITGGTGLGLHVVKRLVEDHGGTFDIQTSDTGTRIYASLIAPVAPEEDPPG